MRLWTTIIGNKDRNGYSMSNRVTKSLTIELNSGKSFEVDVTAVGLYDSNWGADADGNRGMGVWLLEDLEYDLPDTDDEGLRLTNEEMIELATQVELKANDQAWVFSHEDDREYEPELEDK